jgi:outer membrane lipoprotein-sorting protein
MTIRRTLIFVLLLASVAALASGTKKHAKKKSSAAASASATPAGTQIAANTGKDAPSSTDPGKSPDQSKAADKDASSVTAKPTSPVLSLDAVIARMDQTSASFKSAQADFEWEQYQKVVDETDIQKGVIYFRRASKDTQMMSDVTTPEKKQILYSDKKLRLFEPKIDRVTIYDLSKNPAVESYLILGFGGSGQDLLKAFDTKVLGGESVDGVATTKLDLVPKSAKARGTFSRIVLWIDNARGISLRQQFIESSGDYRLARYTNLRLNEKVGDDNFKLHTTGKTTTFTPQNN